MLPFDCLLSAASSLLACVMLDCVACYLIDNMDVCRSVALSVLTLMGVLLGNKF
jgi:hypothetical protein